MNEKCEHHDYTMVEDYIRGLQWSAEATDHEKTLVAGNIRGFYSHIRESLSTRPAESVDEEMTRLMEIHGVSDLPALVRMLLRFNENLRSRQRPDPEIPQRAPREG